MTRKTIMPGAMLGMLGGGQLGRMFTLAAHAMGYRVTVLDPDQASPAGLLADVHLRARYDDREALREMARSCAAVTTEFENVPSSTLAYLAESIPTAPGAASVAIAQDRRVEKQAIVDAGLEVAPYCVIETVADLDQALKDYLPGILKTARFGYDGKGQIRVSTVEEVSKAFADLRQQPCVLEKLQDLDLEVSVIVVRNFNGEMAIFPVAENRHVNGILDVSIVPARISELQAECARRMATQLADHMDYVGVLAVECFVLKDGRILINEIAPRPHNSGHYTQDACLASQFEQQVRMMCNLPPADTRLLSPVVMVNMLGDVWHGRPDPDWASILSEPHCILHLYGKSEARPGRKMGHFNVLAEDVDQALCDAERIRHVLSHPPN